MTTLCIYLFSVLQQLNDEGNRNLTLQISFVGTEQLSGEMKEPNLNSVYLTLKQFFCYVTAHQSLDDIRAMPSRNIKRKHNEKIK